MGILGDYVLGETVAGQTRISGDANATSLITRRRLGGLTVKTRFETLGLVVAAASRKGAVGPRPLDFDISVAHFASSIGEILIAICLKWRHNR